MIKLFGSKDSDSSADELRCSFCGASQHEVQKLIAGKDIYICDQCVDLCSDIIYDGDQEEPEDSLAAAEQAVRVAIEKFYFAAHEADKDPAKSLAIAERILELEPGDIGGRKIRAYCLAKLGNREDAIAEYQSLYREIHELLNESDENEEELAEELSFIRSKLDSL